MNSRYFSCAELVEEINGDAKLKRDDSIRSSLRSTHSRMTAKTSSSLRRDSYRECELASYSVSEVGAAEIPSVENERVCDEFAAPQSPPALGNAAYYNDINTYQSYIKLPVTRYLLFLPR